MDTVSAYVRRTAGLVILASTLAGCSPGPPRARANGVVQTDQTGQVYRRQQPHMGTKFQIQVVAGDGEEAARAIDAAFKEVARVESLISEWQENSEMTEVNANAGGEPVEVSREMVELFTRAAEISRMTGGAFDMTFATCGELWSVREERVPDAAEVRDCLQRVDYRKVRVDTSDSTIRLEGSEMAVGTGAIGKGYGVDAAASVLEEHGYDDYIVDGGGDIRVRGDKLGQPWQVGIADPRQPQQLLGLVQASDGAIVTSGDYERYFVRDGVRYHHIIDPRTGRPARESVAVTVIAETATDADALSTGIFVLGPREGLKLAERTEGVEALVVGPDLTLHTTDGFAEKFRRMAATGQAARDKESSQGAHGARR